MESKSVANTEHDETEVSSYKKTAMILCHQEIIKVNLYNRLHQSFDYQVVNQATIEEGIDFMTTNRTDLVVFDIDDFDLDGMYRVYKIANHLQLPCLFIGTDPSFLNKLRLDMDENFVSFLPKTIMNTMFNDTVKLLLRKTGPQRKLSQRLKDVASLDKPLSLYILAAALLLEPVMKILYMKLQTGFTWDILLRTIFSIQGSWANFEFWAIFPLAGYALISVKAWSFFAFVGVQLYCMYAYFTYEKFTWPYVAETPHISSTFLLFFNFALILYFMVPANRRPYWNKARRLWRNTARYATNMQTFFQVGSDKIATTITNISETGAYFTSDKQFDIGHKMYVELPIEGGTKSLEAVVRRAQSTAHDSFNGYGVEFNFKSRSEKKEVKKFITNLGHRIQ